MNSPNRDPPQLSASERLRRLKQRSSDSIQAAELDVTGLSNMALQQAEAAQQAEQARLRQAEAAAIEAEQLKQRAIKDVTDVKNLEARTRQSLREAEAEAERLREELAARLPAGTRLLSLPGIWMPTATVILLLILVVLVGIKLQSGRPASSDDLIVKTEQLSPDWLLIVYRLPDGSKINGQRLFLGHVTTVEEGTIKAYNLRIEQGKGRHDFTVDLEVPLDYDLKQLHFRLRNANAKKK